MRTIKLVGVLPIPVGHRVEVTYFSVTRDKRGLFGSAEPETKRVEPPRITDLETGVVYAHGSFSKIPETFIRMDQSNVSGLGVREEMSEAESFLGVVRTCQVTVLSNEQTETWLEIEPSDDEDVLGSARLFEAVEKNDRAAVEAIVFALPGTGISPQRLALLTRRDRSGRTAIELAEALGHEEILALLSKERGRMELSE